jgi:hypothetical protein
MALIPNPGDSGKASLGRWFSIIAGTIGAIGSLAGLVLSLVPSLEPAATTSQSASSAIPTWIYVALAIGLFGAAAGEAYRRWIVRRLRGRSQDLDKEIADGARAGASHGELKERMVASTRPGDKRLASHKVDKYFVDEGPQLKEVAAVIINHPPMLPRAAKRMLNHARLLTSIANERGMFGGDPPLEPAQLGKWIVLIERWPTVARRVAREPSLMARLEANAIDSLPPDLPVSDELMAFIGTQPGLGPVLTRLVEIHWPPGAMTHA